MKLGELLAERVATLIGSWRFVSFQSLFLAVWLILNTMERFHGIAWDEPPYILLNLMLSFQAAYTGPILLIAARRQEDNQRKQLSYMLHLMEATKELLEEKQKEK